MAGKEMKDYLPVTRVELELTEACNLFCKFCYNSQKPVTNKKAELIIDRLSQGGIFELILTGGEPTLHPRFFEILEYACRIIPRVMVQSNGVLFAEPANLDRLCAQPIFCLNFSLHGPRKIHDALTGVYGSFEATTKAIKAVVTSGIRIACNMVMTSSNADSSIIREVVDILKNLGVKEMTLTRFIPCGIGNSAKNLALSKERFIDCLDALAFETQKDFSILLANAIPACNIPSRHWDFCSRCSFGMDKFYVDVHGNIMICGMARVRLGNILEHSMSDILEHSSVRHRYLEGTHLPEKCRQCKQLELCGGGCRAAALVQEKRIDGVDPLDFCSESVSYPINELTI
jgi:radical SAM protein with 4Fe4S-binding SPASM domain